VGITGVRGGWCGDQWHPKISLYLYIGLIWGFWYQDKKLIGIVG
jgi:hypothetical protein